MKLPEFTELTVMTASKDGNEICLTEGPEGLALEQRGRGSTGRPNTKAGIFTGIAAGYRSTAPCNLLLSSETDEENR